jgi:hypothetical protein
MPYRRLPNTNASRDAALTTCKDKMEATDPMELPFAPSKGVQLTTDQPIYHGLIAAVNSAKSNQTAQSALVAPLMRTARFWVSHGYQALINACIRDQFPNSVKNLYGLSLDAKGGPELSSEADVIQASITYNDGETARTAAGGEAITFPALADINTHVDALKAAHQTQSTLKGLFDQAQEKLAEANPNTDLLILQLWNSIEATYDKGDKPSMRRKAREWGVVYVPSAGETPTGDDYSVVGRVTDMLTGLPLDNVEISLFNASVDQVQFTGADGMFFMPVVASGNYDLQAKLPGYKLVTANMNLVQGEVQEFNIAMETEAPLLPPVE